MEDIKFSVENLAYVATLCQGNYHAQLLRKGGEFLTHVWLLKEHFNLIESFQKTHRRPQVEEAEDSSVVSDDESGYGQGSDDGSAAESGAYANTTPRTN